MIWCVEDDASIRDIEVYALQSTGFEARGFEDGTSFWDALQGAALPELVVLDVMLPGIDGISSGTEDGESVLDLVMIAKYYERIADHATNIAEWVEFSATGVHKTEIT